MDEKQQGQVGIAKFFSEAQIRELFRRYVSLIIVVEIFLLLIMLCGSVAVYNVPFPTQLYLILAITLPLGMTFLLGIFIMAFNKFIYGRQTSHGENESEEQDGPSGWLSSRHRIFGQIYKIPFIVKLFMMLFLIPILFMLDDIIGFYVGIGAQTVRYLAIAVVVIIGALAVIGVIWLIANFRLKKRQMDYEYQYRKDIMDKLDLMVLGNDTLVDRNGRVISIKPPEDAETEPKMVEGKYDVHDVPSLPLNRKEGG